MIVEYSDGWTRARRWTVEGVRVGLLLVEGGQLVVARRVACSTGVVKGFFCMAEAKERNWLPVLGGELGSWRCPQRMTTIHSALSGLCSLVGGAMGTSSSQRLLLEPSRTRVITLLALVVLGGGWILVVPGPYGLAIGGAVCTVVAVAENGWLCAVNISGWSWCGRYATGVLQVSHRVGGVAQ